MMYHVHNMMRDLKRGHPFGRAFVVRRDMGRIVRTIHHVLEKRAVYRELKSIRMKRVRVIDLPPWPIHPVVQVGRIFGVAGHWQYKHEDGYRLVGASGKVIDEYVRIPVALCENVSWLTYIRERYMHKEVRT